MITFDPTPIPRPWLFHQHGAKHLTNSSMEELKKLNPDVWSKVLATRRWQEQTEPRVAIADSVPLAEAPSVQEVEEKRERSLEDESKEVQDKHIVLLLRCIGSAGGFMRFDCFLSYAVHWLTNYYDMGKTTQEEDLVNYVVQLINLAAGKSYRVVGIANDIIFDAAGYDHLLTLAADAMREGFLKQQKVYGVEEKFVKPAFWLI